MATTLGSYCPNAWILSNAGNTWAAFTPSADGVAAFSSNLGTVKVGGVTNPTLPQDAATKDYVDSVAGSGVTWKDAVNAASVANVVLAPAGAVDGFTPTTVGERALLKNQTTSTEIGIYTYDGTDWVRSTESPVGEQANGSAVFTFGGTVNNDTAWVVTNSTSINWGSAGVIFSLMSSAPRASGNTGDVQFKSATGGFNAATLSTYNFTDSAATPTLLVGVQGGGFEILGKDSTTATVSGCAVAIKSGPGNTTGSGGQIALESGIGGINGNGGSLSLSGGAGGTTTGNGGSLTLTAGGKTAGTAGTITLIAGEKTAANVAFSFEANDNTEVVTIKSDVQAATAAGEGSLIVTGGGTFTSNVYGQTFNATSDVTLKTNIKGIDNPLDKILAIEGYTYDWKDGSNNKKQWGVIAQQLESIGLDDMVSGKEQKAVNYLALIPLLIEAVKELASITTTHV